MSACRRVRWNGRMPMRSRVESSSITRFAGCASIQRSAGISTCSYAAHPARISITTKIQNGRATGSVICLAPL